MSTYFVKQFPVLTFDQIPYAIKSSIIERVAELCYFNHDLDGWMYELWNDDEMTDDIRTDLLVRLAECNNLNFDSGQLTTPDFSLMSPYIYNENVVPWHKPSLMPFSPISTVSQPRNYTTSSTPKMCAAKGA